MCHREHNFGERSGSDLLTRQAKCNRHMGELSPNTSHPLFLIPSWLLTIFFYTYITLLATLIHLTGRSYDKFC